MSTPQGHYSIGLDKTAANFVPLSPLSFLERSASVYPDATSVVYEGRHYTWKETRARCRRFASWLVRSGIGRGDTVAVMLPNVPAMVEAHFAVPMAGAVLNALNIRLDAPAIAFQENEMSPARVALWVAVGVITDVAVPAAYPVSTNDRIGGTGLGMSRLLTDCTVQE